MTVFILLATLLTLAVLGLFIRVARSEVWSVPRRSGSSSELGIVNAELELLRTQRQELEHDVATGRVAVSDHEQSLRELAERADSLLQRRQVLQQASRAAMPSTTKLWPMILAGLAIPVLAVGLYLKLGDPAAIGQSSALVKTTESKADPKANMVEVEGKQITIAELVARLEQKLNEQPDQAEGWMLLGHTKYKLADYAGAATALRKALTLLDQQADQQTNQQPDQKSDLKAMKADLLADLADALVMQQGGNFSGEPEQLFAKALQLNPTHQKALALAASAAMRANQRDVARGYWQRLRDTLPADSTGRTELDGVIAELGGAPVFAPAPVPTSQQTESKTSTRIAGSVTLAASFKDKVQSGDTLFVFARRLVRPGSSGPRMPLAVARFQLKAPANFPQAFALTDAMAMAPGQRLSDADEVEVTARISRSGNAIPTTGDLLSAPLVVALKAVKDSQNLKLVIDRAVP